MKPLKVLVLTISAVALQCLVVLPAAAELHVTVVQGLGGNPLFDVSFTDQRHKIIDASITMAGEDNVTAFNGDNATRENLFAYFADMAQTLSEEDRMAIYLIGHGSYDGEQYKFNIPGPDITDSDLNEIIGSLPGSNHFLVNTSSASGAILDTIDTENRIIITATRNGMKKMPPSLALFLPGPLPKKRLISIRTTASASRKRLILPNAALPSSLNRKASWQQSIHRFEGTILLASTLPAWS